MLTASNDGKMHCLWMTLPGASPKLKKVVLFGFMIIGAYSTLKVSGARKIPGWVDQYMDGWINESIDGQINDDSHRAPANSCWVLALYSSHLVIVNIYLQL